VRSHAQAPSVGSSSGRANRRARVFAAPLAVVALALLALAPTAQASHTVDSFIGAPGQFGPNPSMALDPETGQLYAMDNTATSIRRFSADGEFELSFGFGVETGANAFEVCTADDAPCGPGLSSAAGGGFEGGFKSGAVSPFNGHLYVFDNSDRVQEFGLNDNGTPADPSDDLPFFIRTWGWGVQNGAEEFQVCTSGCRAGVERITDVPVEIGRFNQTNGNNGLAISPVDGDVFVQETREARVLRFNANGSLDVDVGPTLGQGNFGGLFCCPGALAVDSQGILYVGDTQNSAEIERYDTAGAHGPAGARLTPIATPPLLAGSSSSTTASLTVHLDPEGDGAAGSTTDHLYVLRNPATGNTVIQQLDSPGEVVPPATEALPQHAPGVFGTDTGRTLAYHAASNRFYVAYSDTNADPGSGFFILDTDGAAPLSSQIDPFTDAAPTSFEMNGKVSSQGIVRYRFEIAVGAGAFVARPWHAVLASGSTPVSETLTELEPNTTYRVRLYAERVTSVSTKLTQTTGEVQTTTPQAPPDATTRTPHSFTDTSAWLAGDVDPNGLAATYRFEWGTTTAYGNSLPLSPTSAGSGNQAQGQLQELTGLEPNTTYHYRIAAESTAGEDFGDDQTFTTRPAFTGFPERAYEQVTPVDKNGAALENQLLPISPGGNAAAIKSIRAFGDQEFGSTRGDGSGGVAYQSRRNPEGDGWTTRASIPRGPLQTNGNTSQPKAFGGPEDSLMVHVSEVPLTSTDPGDFGGIYLEDLLSQTPMKLVDDKAGAAEDTGLREETGVSVSSDLRHVAFLSEFPLDPADPPDSATKVYEAVDGEVRLVSVAPNGTPFSSNAVVGRAHSIKVTSVGWVHRVVDRSAISEDGRHIFFSTPTAVGQGTYPDAMQIYRRSDGATTALASPSQASTPDPEGPKAKLFSQASADGDLVFFMSSEQLTDDANTGPVRSGRDLYRYELSTDTLIDVSAESNTAEGARVRGLLGMSDDGKWAYYVARGQVVPGEGATGASKVYLWHDDGTADGATRYVTTLGNGELDSGNLYGVDSGLGGSYPAALVSPDGQTLLIQSGASLTGYENQGNGEIYIYEADANNGEGALSCVSCRPDGMPSQGGTRLRNSGWPTFSQGDERPRWLSSDGSRVFFESPQVLLAQDTNGNRDVYMWQAGRLELISAGKGDQGSFLEGASRSGDDVFFLTYDQLVGQDDDGLRDLYDYRVGGGIPEQNQAPPGEPCVGEACKTTIKPVPAPRPPGSDTVTEGNLSLRPNCSAPAKRAKALARRAKKAAAQGGDRKAATLEKRAKRSAGKAKRCRARARGGEGK
jgi:hypothetical protein